jgi:cytochrome c oxidase subunit I
MKDILKKPHLFIGITMLIILFASYFLEAAIDIPMHDTYFVFSTFHFTVISSFFVGFFILLYSFGYKKGFEYPSILTLLHGVTLALIFSFFIFPHLYFQSLPRRHYSFDTFDAYKDTALLQNWSHKLLTLSLIGFFLFFILNVIFGFLNRKKK